MEVYVSPPSLHSPKCDKLLYNAQLKSIFSERQLQPTIIVQKRSIVISLHTS